MFPINRDEQIRITDGEQSLTVSPQAFAVHYAAAGYQLDENFGEDRKMSPDFGFIDPQTYESGFED